MADIKTRLLYYVFHFCGLMVFCEGNHAVTISFNMTVTINCTEESVIKILNITVKENSRCKPKKCELLEEQELNIKNSCDGEKTCNVTSNIPNSCLNDLGFLNYSYTCTGVTQYCDFDIASSKWCGWVKLPTTNGKFRWKRKKGKTSTEETGPNFDHTMKSQDGHYVYTEADDGDKGDNATLTSPRITPSPFQCLSFWYHMYGKNIGLLRVYQKLSQGNKILLWDKSDNTDSWINHNISIKYQKNIYKIQFEGARGDGDEGDIAIDDITVTNNYCHGISNQCQPSDSNQCKTTYQMTCKEVDTQLSFSKCSKQYLTNGDRTLTFDPNFDFCSDIYMRVNHSLCNKTEDSDICSVDFIEDLQNNPDCFNRYSMTIEYTCKEILSTVSKSQQMYSSSKVTGIAVGVSISCGIVAGIVISIYFIRRSEKCKRKKGTSINQQNNYIGDQCVALPQRPPEKSDKIELIGDDESSTPSNVTNEEYTYIDSIHNTSPGTSNFENYVVLDPNETGFNRQGNPIVQTNKVSHKPATNGNANCLRNDTNNQKAIPYEMTTEGAYDTAGTSLHIDNTNTIYNHTVDNVYDTSSHKRKDGEREETYDHFLGQKTEDDYDTTKCT